MLAKRHWYHANGYIKAIGKNARRTIYNPNQRVRRKWQLALRYLIHMRDEANRVLHPPQPAIEPWLLRAFLCIHSVEGAWNANTGNGYYGGLQMDRKFMQTYGPEFIQRWGTADNWPVWAQLRAGKRAHDSGRGFGPWPNTARYCGLL